MQLSRKLGFSIFFLFLLLLLHLHCISACSIDGRIKTVVVLVMENRSFDHMLGFLKRLNPHIDGLNGDECNPLNTTDKDSPLVCVADTAEFVDPDPGHSYQAIREQVFGSADTSANPPPMNGFAQQAEDRLTGLSKRVMMAFRPEVIPAYTALAMEYAVFDRWFSSVPASTQPNRFYVHSATSNGAMSNVRSRLIEGFPQKSIFESVEAAGLSFGIYYQNIPATLFFRNLRKLKYITKFHDYNLRFKLDAARGKLPNYCVIEQRYFDSKAVPANDDHPSHDVAEGQKFVKEVYETLRTSPQWNEILFIITYDEHGGFYDHVATPVDDVPNPDGLIGAEPYFFDFMRLGVRVPTIMVSPWIEKGTVVHGPDGPTTSSQFEHSSISATVKKIFNLPDFLTKRDAWAGTFENILYGRNTPRTDCPGPAVLIPSPPWSLRHSPASEENSLTEFQEELVMLASQLNGDHQNPKYPHLGRHMNVGQANAYVMNSVAQFLKSGRQALEAGVDEESLVKVKSEVEDIQQNLDQNYYLSARNDPH